MAGSENSGFYLADWRVSPREGLLSRGDEIVRLEPRTMEVLVYLANHPGEVIDRETLERVVWKGALVGYDAVTNTVIKLRKAMQDDARNPRFIATIPKKGYQLIAEVHHANKFEATEVCEQNSVESESIARPIRRVKQVSKNWVVITGLLVVLIFVVVWGWLGKSENRVDAPTIIVLPFENLSGEAKQDYLADGITEDIITDLSKMSNLKVLASNTSVRYKNRDVTAEQVREELNVGFVLTGNIRQFGGALRINTQLVDTATGYNVWAQRYDRKIAEVFVVQDEVTQSIVKALAIKLTNQEKKRLAHRTTDNLKAYDYFQEGQRLFRDQTRESNHQAQKVYRKAIEADPGYGRAYGALSITMAQDYRRGWSDSPIKTIERAIELARIAVELDGNIPQTWWALGFVHLHRKEFKQALLAAKRSTEIAPNYADGYGLQANIHGYLGEARQAIEINDRAIQLNPYYTYEYLITYGIAYYTLGDIKKSIEMFEKILERNINNTPSKLYLAACYVRENRLDDAQWMALELQALENNLTIAHIENAEPLAKSEHIQMLRADLRKAGMPE